MRFAWRTATKSNKRGRAHSWQGSCFVVHHVYTHYKHFKKCDIPVPSPGLPPCRHRGCRRHQTADPRTRSPDPSSPPHGSVGEEVAVGGDGRHAVRRRRAVGEEGELHPPCGEGGSRRTVKELPFRGGAAAGSGRSGGRGATMRCRAPPPPP